MKKVIIEFSEIVSLVKLEGALRFIGVKYVRIEPLVLEIETDQLSKGPGYKIEISTTGTSIHFAV